MLTKEQDRVLRLNKKLLNRDSFLEDMKYQCVDRQWDCHHCAHVYLTEAVKQYQVIRCYSVEIDVDYEWEMRFVYENKHLFEQYFDENGDLTDDFEYELVYDKVDDPDEHFYDIQIWELCRAFINTQTGAITYTGKPYFNGDGCDVEAVWQLINANQMNRKQRKFLERFGNMTSLGWVKDISIHPALQKRGWEPLDSFNWYYGCGEDDNFSDESKLTYQRSLVDFYSTLIKGTNPIEQRLKIFGMHITGKINAIDNPDYQIAYETACRIAKRHHYEPKNEQIWDDMIDFAYKLGKDIHSPHYVCPEDLYAMHDTLLHQYERQRAQIELQEKIAKNKAKLEKDQMLRERSQRFFDLIFKGKNIVIKPLLTPEDYAEEGTAMHHCVNTYFSKGDALILSARDEQGNRLSTIEVSLSSFRIIQNRALCNGKPEKEDEINRIIYNNMAEIKERKFKKLPKAA